MTLYWVESLSRFEGQSAVGSLVLEWPDRIYSGTWRGVGISGRLVEHLPMERAYDPDSDVQVVGVDYFADDWSRRSLAVGCGFGVAAALHWLTWGVLAVAEHLMFVLGRFVR